MNKYSAAIIGLGQVGQGYDYTSNDESVILTHASALKYHNGFDLILAGENRDPANIESCRARIRDLSGEDLVD